MMPSHPPRFKACTCNLGLLHQLYYRGFPYSLFIKKNWTNAHYNQPNNQIQINNASTHYKKQNIAFVKLKWRTQIIKHDIFKTPHGKSYYNKDYNSNSHTYRVYNNFTRKVEETVDVKFDESNGSQVEQLPIDVGDKDPSEAIQDLRNLGEL